MNRREFISVTAATSIAAYTKPSAADENKVSKEKYRACVIGDSRRGGYGHGLHLIWALRDDVEVVGLADPDEKGRKKHAAEAGARRIYSDYRKMLEKEQPDLVSIGPRWTAHHREYLLACAEIGAHGVIEKPLATDLEEADEMVEAVEAKGLKWAIAFNVRAAPPIQTLKRLIWDEALIGTMLEARGRGKEDHRAGGEDLIVLGVHVFDMMAYLLDATPQWCWADITVDGRPAAPGDVHDPTEPVGPVVGDTIHAVYGFGNGTIGRFDSVKNPDGNKGRFGLDICGTGGIVTIRFGDVPIIHHYPQPSWSPTSKGTTWQTIPKLADHAPKSRRHERNKPIADDLISAIEENRRPAVSIQDGRTAQEMIQAAYASHVCCGRVEMPLTERAHPLLLWSKRLGQPGGNPDRAPASPGS